MQTEHMIRMKAHIALLRAARHHTRGPTPRSNT